MASRDIGPAKTLHGLGLRHMLCVRHRDRYEERRCLQRIITVPSSSGELMGTSGGFLSSTPETLHGLGRRHLLRVSHRNS